MEKLLWRACSLAYVFQIHGTSCASADAMRHASARTHGDARVHCSSALTKRRRRSSLYELLPTLQWRRYRYAFGRYCDGLHLLLTLAYFYVYTKVRALTRPCPVYRPAHFQTGRCISTFMCCSSMMSSSCSVFSLVPVANVVADVLSLSQRRHIISRSRAARASSRSSTQSYAMGPLHACRHSRLCLRPRNGRAPS